MNGGTYGRYLANTIESFVTGDGDCTRPPRAGQPVLRGIDIVLSYRGRRAQRLDESIVRGVPPVPTDAPPPLILSFPVWDLDPI